MRRLVLAALLAASLTAPAWAGFDDGVAAYNLGDYLRKPGKPPIA